MAKRWYLSHELIAIMLVKLAIIYGIWALCFSHPVDKHLTAAAVSQHWVHAN